MTMLVLIDESGDPGFKPKSSRYFFITMVVFRHCTEGRFIAAEQVASVITRLHEETGHRSEFHFSQCSHKVRQAFFQGLNKHNCEFEVFSLSIDKKEIYSPALKSNTKNFYNFILKQLLSHNPVKGANVKIDGDKSTAFRKALKAYLRVGKDGMVKKLNFANSKNDQLVQLADMVCGAIAYSIARNDKLEADGYLKMLGKRVKNIWDFK